MGHNLSICNRQNFGLLLQSRIGISLHVTHLFSLVHMFSSYIAIGFCIQYVPRGSSQYFQSVVHMNLNAVNYVASYSFKAIKKLCVETMHFIG